MQCAAAYTINRTTEEAFALLRDGATEQGILQLKKAAAVNDVTAQYYMGVCYEFGLGFDADAEKAFGMYRRAAERGFAPAMQSLAHCYSDGIGVAANEAKAREWTVRYERKHDGTEIPDIISLYNQSASKQPLKPATAPKTSPTRRNSAAPKTQAATQPQPVGRTAQKPAPAAPKSDVDEAIPTTRTVRENTFALIIANEDYQDVAKVPNALNDGEVLAAYCTKTLGLPATNVHVVKNATLNNIRREINLMKQIAEAYGGDASFIVYYAGHGIPDEESRDAYLLPVDGYSADLTTCYSLKDFYETIGSLPSRKTVVFLDACFSGSSRGEGMLASARGVAIKAKSAAPAGNMVVMTSAQGDETAYPYMEKNHGLFTYYLLKKLKETKGAVSLGELADYLRENVQRKSIVVNGKSQTPSVSPSQNVGADWKNWKLN